MRNWNWTPRAKTLATIIQAVVVVIAGWILFVGTWFAMGGN
jgi:Na+/pantothenate symporter